MQKLLNAVAKNTVSDVNDWLYEAHRLVLQTDAAVLADLIRSAPADVQKTTEYYLVAGLHYAARESGRWTLAASPEGKLAMKAWLQAARR